METLLLSLLGWLYQHTDYDDRVVLPNITVTEVANLCQNYGVDSLADCQAMQLKGFYNEQRTIFLHADFRQTNLQDQSWLVHELVHYLQWKQGANQQCWGKLEAEAYQVQDAWLQAHGINAQTDPFKLIMLEAACD